MWNVHSQRLRLCLKVAGILACIYFFIVGIGGMGHGFKLFGQEFAERLLKATEDPLTGICLGLLATSLVQSSSTTTSILVGMVAGGAISLNGAIPIVMGANMGTTITSMLVSLGHIRHPPEYRRGFSAAAVHCTFNLACVAILLPLELLTGFLTHAAQLLAEIFAGMGGMRLSDPLEMITEPTIEFLAWIVRENAFLMLLLSIGLIYSMLVAIVKLLRSLVLRKLEYVFDAHLFRNTKRAVGLGLFVTFAVQSSSIPTSLVIPLAASGILRLSQIYPFSLGCNLGTTLTAILAALATGNQTAISVSFAHLLFNVFGIALIWPIPALRRIPLILGEKMGNVAFKNRFLPVCFILGVYFAIPAVVLLIIQLLR